MNSNIGIERTRYPRPSCPALGVLGFNQMTMTGMTCFDAGRLFAVAKEAYNRTLSVEGDVPSNDALVAILFSTSTLEAYMSQAVFFAKKWAHLHPKIAAFSSFLGDLDSKEVGASLKTRYDMARYVVCGSPFNRGEQPFQDFSLLVDVRNALVHLKPDSQPNKRVERLLQSMQSRSLLRNYNSESRGMWTNYILHSVAAKWACNTASEMIQAFWNGVAEDRVELFFRIDANAAHYTKID